MAYSSKDKWIGRDLSEAYWFQEGPGVRNWQFTSSGIKLLNVANITKLGTIDLNKTERCLSEEEVEKKYKHFLVDIGDLVIASSGISFDTDGLLRTRGAFVQKEHLPLCMNTSTIRFKAKEGVSDLNFLKFWLDSYEFREQITRLVTGSAQQNFGPSHLKSIQIKLPPLREQKRIAAIAQKADRLRRTRRYALQLSNTYLPSVFLEMFGDPVTNPMGWQMHPLNKHLTFITSGARGWAQYYAPSGTRFIRSFDVQMNHISQSDAVFVKPPDSAETQRTQVQPNDVLLTITGSRIGRVAPVPVSIGTAYVSQHVAILRLDKSLHPLFLSMFLSEERGGQEQIRKMQYGQTKPGLNFDQIRAFKIPYPPFHLQEKFAQIVQKFERLRTQQREGDRQAEHLFQTLLHRAFRGELTPQHANDEPASVLLEEIGAEQAQAEAEAKAATQVMGDAAEYLGTKAKQQDTEPIQLTLPGIE
jgi:type I restriction enzyme S subunit